MLCSQETTSLNRKPNATMKAQLRVWPKFQDVAQSVPVCATLSCSMLECLPGVPNVPTCPFFRLICPDASRPKLPDKRGLICPISCGFPQIPAAQINAGIFRIHTKDPGWRLEQLRQSWPGPPWARHNAGPAIDPEPLQVSLESKARHRQHRESRTCRLAHRDTLLCWAQPGAAA